MSKKLIIKKGDKYGRLSILRELKPKIYKNFLLRKFECKCECGTITHNLLGSLTSGKTKSCGCLASDTAKKTILHVLKLNKLNGWECKRKILLNKGERFGNLIILNEEHSHRRPNGALVRYFKCQCDCGNISSVSLSNLMTKKTTSCGCKKIKHGMSCGSKIYMIWGSMKKRCVKHKDYGGRGIKVCARWLNSFENFYADMGEKPKGLTLDRINNDGNYCPENCRWATAKQQSRNTRVNRMITYKGETMCVAQWAEKLNIKSSIIRQRLYKNWNPIKAIITPIRIYG